ncbi:vegetative cell wall protein gp1-like [Felis catus]|uniref:vegetative cell wall protein gp1-like n=1 Tax=Felis catus TaxID=9685 RepID=UPI001D199960|nr:vegetative cell wall protein gp1-like [Felis catus]
MRVLLEETKHQKPPWRARAASNWPRGGRGRGPGSLADLRCGEAGVPGGSGRPRAKSRSGPGAHAAALPDSLAPGAGAGRFGALPAAAAPRAPRGAATRPPGPRPLAAAAGAPPARGPGAWPANGFQRPPCLCAPRGSGRHLAAAFQPLTGLPSPPLPALYGRPSGQEEARWQQPAPSLPLPPPPPPPPREDGARAFWLPPVGALRTQVSGWPAGSRAGRRAGGGVGGALPSRRRASSPCPPPRGLEVQGVHSALGLRGALC